MAKTAPRTNNHGKGFYWLGVFVVLVLMERAGATQFKVGGGSGWTVPSDPTAYNQWAQKNRFQIGDSLLFVYQPGQDSVLEVSKDDYSNCNTKSSSKYFNDGNTSFMFNQSGPHYFISGNEQNCLKNESLMVIVMASRTPTPSISNSTTNATSPSPLTSPPSSPPEINPTSPPPSSPPEINPTSPPPSSPPEINPTSPPPSALTPAVTETPSSSPPPPPNGVPSSKAVSFVGSIGVLGSGLLLVL